MQNMSGQTLLAVDDGDGDIGTWYLVITENILGSCMGTL